MGRKRDQGKARRKKAAEEAKAKQRQEQAEQAKAKEREEQFNKALGEEMENDEDFRRWLLTGGAAICKHCFDDTIDNDCSVQFVKAFKAAWEDAVCARR